MAVARSLPFLRRTSSAPLDLVPEPEETEVSCLA
jgi:hypothetical protein